MARLSPFMGGFERSMPFGTVQAVPLGGGIIAAASDGRRLQMRCFNIGSARNRRLPAGKVPDLKPINVIAFGWQA